MNDSDANYISVALDAKEEGDWTFAASAGSGTITSIKLRLEALLTVADCGSLEVYVWNGTAWVLAASYSPNYSSYAWREIDVSAILNTWAKINGAEVYVLYSKDLTGTCRVRRLTRKVDYSAFVAHSATFAEVFGALDGKTRVKTTHRTLTEILGSLDGKSRAKTIHRTLTEKFGVLDAKTRAKSLFRTILETLGLSDAFNKTLGIPPPVVTVPEVRPSAFKPRVRRPLDFTTEEYGLLTVLIRRMRRRRN